MTGGRKRVPTALRKLHGNPRDHAMPTDEPEGVGDLWSPPDWFDDDQRKQWNYAVDHSPPGLLTGTDRETLGIWVVACVEYAKAVVEVRTQGQVVETKDGNAIQNPFLSIMNKQAMIMLKAGSEMGFSPSARASLGSRLSEGFNARSRGAIGGSLAGYLEQKPDPLDS